MGFDNGSSAFFILLLITVQTDHKYKNIIIIYSRCFLAWKRNSRYKIGQKKKPKKQLSGESGKPCQALDAFVAWFQLTSDRRFRNLFPYVSFSFGQQSLFFFFFEMTSCPMPDSQFCMVYHYKNHFSLSLETPVHNQEASCRWSFTVALHSDPRTSCSLLGLPYPHDVL